mmetsp:Transcript_2724/g.4936  ORF Transcript_2724/g.4936 Transcript_2724/m.4936 type:complete len:271 (+) Transcript_2724:48-860(+)
MDEKGSAFGSSCEKNTICVAKGGSDCISDDENHASSSDEAEAVPHIRQKYSWDCGLACVEMVLRSCGQRQVSYDELRRWCGTESVWSIDLVFLLHRLGMDVSYLTVTKGVRPEYILHQFYRRELQRDSVRVNDLFQRAADEGVQIEFRSVAQAEIIDVLKNGAILVVLVDKRQLQCKMCEGNSSSALSRNSISFVYGFLGHYIVIYKYDPKGDVFVFKDPASQHPRCEIESSVLEKARMAFGTDEDILVIRRTRTDVSGIEIHPTTHEKT